MSTQVRISATMALDSLREQCETVAEAKAAYEVSLDERDALIRDLRGIKVPYGTIMTTTGLSRDRLIAIAHSGPRRVSGSDSTGL